MLLNLSIVHGLLAQQPEIMWWFDVKDSAVVGGHTVFPDFENNYGRAYMVSTNSPGGPDWLMFRRDSVRSAHVPIEDPSAVSAALSDIHHVRVFPNPMFGEAQISYSLPEKMNVHIRVLDVYGRELVVLKNKMEYPGHYNMSWEKINAIPAGIYFCKFNFNGEILAKKLVINKR